LLGLFSAFTDGGRVTVVEVDIGITPMMGSLSSSSEAPGTLVVVVVTAGRPPASEGL
jgi:hypothetical protein